MGRPYSIIQRADELKLAKDAYDTWLKKSLAEKQTVYQNHVTTNTQNPKTARANVAAYLIPFAVEQSKKVWAKATTFATNPPGAEPPKTEGEGPLTTAFAAALIGAAKYVTTVAPTTEGTYISKAKASRLAKCTIVEVDSSAKKTINSRITGRPYTYRKKDSLSSVIGQEIGGDAITFPAVIQEISGNTTLIPTDSNRRVYFRPERAGDITVV